MAIPEGDCVYRFSGYWLTSLKAGEKRQFLEVLDGPIGLHQKHLKNKSTELVWKAYFALLTEVLGM